MNSDLTAQVYQYLASAPGSHFAQQDITMIAHWAGDANLLWRVAASNQQAVVKLFLDAGQARSRRQYDGQLLFAPLGLAPQPLWADRYPHGLSRQLIVYQWCDGEPITPDAPGALWAWAESVGTLHAAPVEDVRRFSPQPLNLDTYWRIEQASLVKVNQWLSNSGLALEQFFRQLSTASDALVQANLSLWSGVMPTAIHGDLSRAHTLLERGRALLLDWEMFGLGDPALDVARLLQREAQALTGQQIASWLDRYQQIVDRPTVTQRIDIYRRLLEAHNVVYLLVGLQQHSANTSDDLAAALPFMQETLAAAIERTCAALGIEASPSASQTAAQFMAWFSEKSRGLPH